jgi:signal transduction histidine kinase
MNRLLIRAQFLLFILLWMAPWGSVVSAHQMDTLFVKGPVNDELSRYYTWFENKDGKLPLSAVLDSLKAGKFHKTITDGAFNKGFTKSAYWLAIYIKNDTTIRLPVLWSFYNNNITFTLYEANKKTGAATYYGSSSSMEPLSKRPYPVRSISFRVDLQPQESKLLLVKAQTINADNIYFPTDITTVDDFLEWETHYTFLIGRYVGYFMFALVFNILLWLALKNRIHLWHAAYVMSLIGFNLNEFLFDSFTFPDWLYHLWVCLPKSMFLLLPVYFSFHIFQLFVNQKQEFPVFYKLFSIYKIIALAVLTIVLFNAFALPFDNIFVSVGRRTAYYFSFAGLVLLVANIITGIIRRHYYTILYSISTIFLLFAFLDFILNTLQVGQLFFISPGNITVAFTFEILALTVIFVFKYKDEKNSSIKALNETVTLRNSWATEIIKVQESERERIARDLHDDVGATLSTLKLHLSNIPLKARDQQETADYERTMELISKITEDVRAISHDLLPHDFINDGLFFSLQNRVDELNYNGKIKFQLVIEGDETTADHTTAMIIYRIVNELITNIIKHSDASEASAQLALLDTYIQIIIEDNGIGMNTVTNKSGIGLRNIAKRVEFLNGEMHIDSSKKGSTFIITIPVLNNNHINDAN